MKLFAPLIPLMLLPFWALPSWAANIATQPSNQAWSFNQPLQIDALNISGIVVTETFIALATDEGHQLQLLKAQSPGQWTSPIVINLTQATDELDIEDLAWQAPYLYAIGSHGLKRSKMDDKDSQKKNLKRLAEVVAEPARNQLFRIELDANLQVVEIQSLSLTEALQDHPILARFTNIPSKENGLDIEGLAISPKGNLLIGLRGPVLRGNVVPVLELKLKKKHFALKEVETHYLDTQGLGIRGLSETPDGYLVLTGAVGDQALPYQVALWNGENGLPGKDITKNGFIPLCDLPSSAGKPEGIQFLQQTANQIQFVIVQDGLTNGQATTFSCPR